MSCETTVGRTEKKGYTMRRKNVPIHFSVTKIMTSLYERLHGRQDDLPLHVTEDLGKIS